MTLPGAVRAVALLIILALLLTGCNQAPEGRFSAGPNLPGATALAVGYIDDNPWLDLVLAGPGQAIVMVGTGPGGAAGGFERLGTLMCPRCEIVAAAVGDLDEDDKEDVLLLTPGALRIYRNVGDGFEPRHPIPLAGDDATSVALADADNDGRLDITLLHADGSVALHRNTGTELAAPATIASGARAFAYLLQDDDLFLELAIASAEGVHLLRNRGLDANRTWQGLAPAELVAGSTKTAATLAPIDADNDQRVDLAAAGPDGIELLENTGRWLAPKPLSPTRATWVAPIDIDNDGWVDLVAGDGESARIVANRDGTWKAAHDVAPGDHVAIGDWDRDGRVDLATFTEDGGEIQWNRGSAGHFLSLRLRGKESVDSGLGIKVTLTTGNSLMLRQSGGMGSPSVALAPDVHFGLGDELSGTYSLAILWPSGILQFDSVDNPEEIVDRHTISRESPMDAPWNGC